MPLPMDCLTSPSVTSSKPSVSSESTDFFAAVASASAAAVARASAEVRSAHFGVSSAYAPDADAIGPHFFVQGRLPAPCSALSLQGGRRDRLGRSPGGGTACHHTTLGG